MVKELAALSRHLVSVVHLSPLSKEESFKKIGEEKNLKSYAIIYIRLTLFPILLKTCNIKI